MNEMYDMSIVMHFYGVVGILGVILVNFLMLQNASDIYRYKRLMRIFTPIGSIGIGFIVFTGVIMMAAKHLDFTIENIVMILFSIIIIVLEASRAKKLKYTNPKELDALDNFKPYAIKIFLLESVVVLSISTWMWII
jgi:uncharacterized protein with PQ loop repeat